MIYGNLMPGKAGHPADGFFPRGPFLITGLDKKRFPFYFPKDSGPFPFFLETTQGPFQIFIITYGDFDHLSHLLQVYINQDMCATLCCVTGAGDGESPSP